LHRLAEESKKKSFFWRPTPVIFTAAPWTVAWRTSGA
jgi:hypothetical protein